MQPGDADPLSDREILNPFAQLGDSADDLVARDYGRAPLLEFALYNVKIGPADAAR
jgi:hypothetical protein